MIYRLGFSNRREKGFVSLLPIEAEGLKYHNIFLTDEDCNDEVPENLIVGQALAYVEAFDQTHGVRTCVKRLISNWKP